MKRPVRKFDSDRALKMWGGPLYKIKGFWMFLNKEEYSDGFRLEELRMGKYGPTSLERTGRYWPPEVTLSDAARYIIAERTHYMECIKVWLKALRSGVPKDEARPLLHTPFCPENGLIAPRCEAW